MLKKGLAMMLTGAMLMASLTGCGSGGPEQESTANSTEQASNEAEAESEAGAAESGEDAGTETGSDATDLSGEITFSINRSEEEIAEMYQPIADRFMEENPGTKVTVIMHETDAQVARTQLNAGEFPDVSIAPRDIPPSELSRFYLPIGDQEELSEKYLYASLLAKDGQTYALPNGVTHCGILYNQSVLDEYLDGQVPKTLDEWYAAAETLAAAGIVPLWTNAGSKWPMAEWDRIAIAISDDPGYRNSLMGVKEPWVEGSGLYEMASIFETFVKNGWIEEDTVLDQWDTSRKMLAEGKVGFMVLGSWAVPQLKDVAATMGTNPDDIGFAPIPYKNDVSSADPLNVLVVEDMMYAINKDTESPELAKKFLEYFLASEAPSLLGLSSPVVGGDKAEWVKDFATMDYVKEMQEDLPDEEMRELCNELQLDIFIGGTWLVTNVLEPVKNGGENTLDSLNQLWSENIE